MVRVAFPRDRILFLVCVALGHEAYSLNPCRDQTKLFSVFSVRREAAPFWRRVLQSGGPVSLRFPEETVQPNQAIASNSSWPVQNRLFCVCGRPNPADVGQTSPRPAP